MSEYTAPALEQPLEDTAAAAPPANASRLARMVPGLSRPMLLFLLYNLIFNFGLYGVTDVVLNFYFVSLGVPDETIGILQTLTRVGGMLAGIPAGMLADRFGARRVTMIAMLASAASYIPLLAWPSLPVLVFSRILLGLSFTSGLIAATPLLVSLVTPQHRTYALSYYQIVSLMGTSLGALVGGFLPATLIRLVPGPIAFDGPAAQSPTAYGLTLAVGGALLVLSILPLLPMIDPHHVARQNASSAKPARIPWLWLAYLCLPWLLFGMSAGLTFPFYNLFFRERFDAPDTVVGTILSTGWLAMGIIGLIAPWLEKRLGRLRALFLTSTIAAVMFVVLGSAQTLPLGVLAYIISASVRNMFALFFTPVILDAFGPRLYSISSGFGSLVWNMGYFMSGTLSGYLIASEGFGFIMNIVAVLVFTTAGITWWMFARRQHAAPIGGA